MKRILFLSGIITFCHSVSLGQYTLYFDSGTYMYGYTHDKTGVNLPDMYFQAHPFKNNLALVKTGHYSLIDTNGTEVKSFDYINMRPVQGTDYFSFRSEKSVGYVNAKGDVLNEFAVDSSFNWQEDGRGYVIFQGGKLGLFTMDYGMTIAPAYECDNFGTTFMYDGNLYFSDSSLFALKRNGKYGIMSMYTGPVVPFEYDRIIQLHDDHYGACKDGKWALLDKKTGKPLTGFNYDYFFGRYQSPIHIPREHDPFIFYKDGKIVFFDVTDRKEVGEVPPAQYEWQVPAYIMLMHNGKYGVINPKGEWMFEPVYDYIGTTLGADTSQKLPTFIVQSGGKTGLCLPTGKFLVPMSDYDFITMERIDNALYYVVTKNQRMALFNSSFKPITGFDFSSINVDGVEIYVSGGGKTGTMTPAGKVTWDK